MGLLSLEKEVKYSLFACHLERHTPLLFWCWNLISSCIILGHNLLWHMRSCWDHWSVDDVITSRSVEEVSWAVDVQMSWKASLMTLRYPSNCDWRCRASVSWLKRINVLTSATTSAEQHRTSNQGTEGMINKRQNRLPMCTRSPYVQNYSTW